MMNSFDSCGRAGWANAFPAGASTQASAERIAAGRQIQAGRMLVLPSRTWSPGTAGVRAHSCRPPGWSRVGAVIRRLDVAASQHGRCRDRERASRGVVTGLARTTSGVSPGARHGPAEATGAAARSRERERAVGRESITKLFAEAVAAELAVERGLADLEPGRELGARIIGVALQRRGDPASLGLLEHLRQARLEVHAGEAVRRERGRLAVRGVEQPGHLAHADRALEAG